MAPIITARARNFSREQAKLRDGADVLSSLIGFRVTDTKPNKNGFGQRVDIAHQHNLLLLLAVVLLVDADCINPYCQ
jgi:hypothetical protein